MVVALRPDIRTIRTLATSVAAIAALATAAPSAHAERAPQPPVAGSLLDILQPVTGGVVQPVVTATAATPLAPLAPAVDTTVGTVVGAVASTADQVVRPTPIVGAPLADAISANGAELAAPNAVIPAAAPTTGTGPVGELLGGLDPRRPVTATPAAPTSDGTVTNESRSADRAFTFIPPATTPVAPARFTESGATTSTTPGFATVAPAATTPGTTAPVEPVRQRGPLRDADRAPIVPPQRSDNDQLAFTTGVGAVPVPLSFVPLLVAPPEHLLSIPRPTEQPRAPPVRLIPVTPD